MIDTNERLLVADDDENLLKFLVRSLKKQGYDVTSAADGFQALEELHGSSSFSVLVTDLLMPHMSGLELLRRTRAMDPYIEIIVITAADSVELAITAMKEGGVYDYLQKPLDSPGQLTMVVERAIAHRRLVLERADLQQKAETERRRLLALVSSVSDAILVVAADGEIVVANPAARKMIGADDVIGEPALQVLPPRLVGAVNNWKAMGGQNPAVLELPWKGDTIQMVSLTPIQDDQDNWQGWALVMRDITPFKRLDELKTLAMIDSANKFRRPLAEAMSALADLNVMAATDDRMLDNVYKLTEAWKRIQSYSDELVKMAHQEASQESQVSEVDIKATLVKIENELNTEMFWQGRSRLVMSISSDLAPLQTDADMLYQLLKGLVKRAALRTPLGGSIRVDAREINGRVYIDVSDEGPSVSDTGVLHMFDRSGFDPASSNRNPAVELTRAKALLDEVGGQLWIGGKTRRGSTVTICLPAVARLVDRKKVREMPT